jgi:hypothetical protein
MPDIRIGQIGNSYYYRIGAHISKNKYANRQSAWWNSRRPQRIVDGKLEPAAGTHPAGQIWY